MKRSTSKRQALLFLTVLLGLSACGSGPAPRLYLPDNRGLLLQEHDVQREAAARAGLNAIGVRAVELPGYADDEQITSLVSPGIITKDDDHRWADEPEQVLMRQYMQSLRQYTMATVLAEPWPRDYAPVVRLELLFDRFLRRSDGGASLNGFVHVLSGDGRQLMQAVPFIMELPGSNTEHTEFMHKLAVAMNRLAAITIEAILEE